MKFITPSGSLPALVRCIGLALLTAIVAMPLMAAESPYALVDAGPAKPLSTYKPKAGETLDKVILKTMGANPLSTDVLRKAFMDLNPQAFSIGKVPKIRPGVTLKVPDLHKLIQSILEPQSKETEVAQSVRASQLDAPDERRRWVRYP